MKRILYILGAAALLASCSEQGLDPLTGKYPAPTDVTYTSVAVDDIVKAESSRSFALSFKGENAPELKAVFIGNKYYLHDATYTPADASSAKSGNYVLGQTLVGGSAVTSGSITLSVDGEKYSLSGSVWVENGEIYRLSGDVTLTFEPDAEPVNLNSVLSASSNITYGIKSLTLTLASSGVSSYYDMSTWSTVYTGTGNYLALDIYSEDGYLHPGTYTPSAAGGTIGEGEYGIGYDTEMWGMSFYNWGTCWWTVTDGVTSAEKITSGDIVVEKSGSRYTITLDQGRGGVYCIFKGAIEAVDPDGNSTVTADYSYTEELSDVTDASWSTVAGVKAHNITLTDSEDAVVAAFSLILSEDTTEIEGTYTVAEYASEPYQAGNGWDLSAWGWGMGGSYYYSEGTLVLINAGESIEVTKLAEGIYSFEGSTGYSFTAALK